MSQEPDSNSENQSTSSVVEITQEDWGNIYQTFEALKRTNKPKPPLRLARFVRAISELRFMNLNVTGNREDYSEYLSQSADEVEKINLIVDYAGAFPDSQVDLATEELWQTGQELLRKASQQMRESNLTFSITDLIIDLNGLFPDRNLGVDDDIFQGLKQVYNETLELAEKLDKEVDNGMTVALPALVAALKLAFPERFEEINFNDRAQELTKKQAQIAKSKGYWLFFIDHAYHLQIAFS